MQMKDYIDEEWEQFLWDITHLNIDPWLDPNCAMWAEQYNAYAYAYFLGEEA